MVKFLHKYYGILITAAIMLTTINGLAAQVILSVKSNSAADIGDNCKWQQVDPSYIRSVRPSVFPWSPTNPPYIDIDTIPQHSWVIDMPECDLVKQTRTFAADLQQGTKFVTSSDSGDGFKVKLLAQTMPHPDTPNGSGKLKDRAEYEFVPKDAQTASSPLGEWLTSELLKVNNGVRYVTFGLYFDSNYEPPDLDSWTQHFQIHQRGGSAPPMALRVMPTANATDPIVVQLELLRQWHKDQRDLGNEAPADTVLGALLPNGKRAGLTLARNTWHKFTIKLQPRTTNQTIGRLTVWKDDVEIFDANQYWGYDAVSGDNGSLSIKLGTYRRRQNRTQNMRFDNFIYGFTQASVMSGMTVQKRNSKKR